jgi:hypothetical protein
MMNRHAVLPKVTDRTESLAAPCAEGGSWGHVLPGVCCREDVGLFWRSPYGPDGGRRPPSTDAGPRTLPFGAAARTANGTSSSSSVLPCPQPSLKSTSPVAVCEPIRTLQGDHHHPASLLHTCPTGRSAERITIFRATHHDRVDGVFPPEWIPKEHDGRLRGSVCQGHPDAAAIGPSTGHPHPPTSSPAAAPAATAHYRARIRHVFKRPLVHSRCPDPELVWHKSASGSDL